MAAAAAAAADLDLQFKANETNLCAVETTGCSQRGCLLSYAPFVFDQFTGNEGGRGGWVDVRTFPSSFHLHVTLAC